MTPAEKKAAGICPADRLWQVGNVEITLSCDLYENHSMPRHRTVVGETITIMWEK